MSRSVYRAGLAVFASIVLANPCVIGLQPVLAQEELIDRPGPPPVDDLEIDKNEDGIPDGWYNARDMKVITEGGPAGPHFVRFECTQPGRPARLSRAFGVDGRKTEAVVLGFWIRQNITGVGEREGDEPGLMIDFLGVELRHLSRGIFGPWTRTVRDKWTRVAKRIAVPPGTKDAILSLGLMGATGTLDFDGFTVDLIPVGGKDTTNLVTNSGFELGDPGPAYWVVEGDTRRVFPGFRSSSAAELTRAKSRLLCGIALPVDGFQALDVSVASRCNGLRGAGGALAGFFFLDEFGKPLVGHERGDYFLSWAGKNDWQVDEASVRVPPGAVRAVLQFEKLDSVGSLRLDDVTVTASPNPGAGSWTPYHVEDETGEWLPVLPSRKIAAKSALDVSFLAAAPAGAHGFVSVKDGRLAFADGRRARFFGASFIPPTAFQPREQADLLVDRLARSGINLVRLGELDTAYGPNRSLFDDTRDDTKAFDPESLARLDHLIAACKARGIYVALELQGKRRFRSEDGVALAGMLPPGGPAAQFDPKIGALALDSARALLAHVNPETGLALRDDPVLAWITLAGEVSLFNLIDAPDALPAPYAKALQTLAEKARGGPGRRFWESVESAHCRQMAEALRKDHVRVPIAGVSHWRRESEFNAAQAATGLDLIDDRLFWTPLSPFVSPEKRSLLWSGQAGSLVAQAAIKRRSGRPYVLGMWCNYTQGAWSFPHEAADQILGVYSALAGDWDGLVRRGIFVFPSLWGEGPVGTVGGEDIFQLLEVINGSPHIYALWPHAASLFLRGHQPQPNNDRRTANGPGRAAAKTTSSKTKHRSASRWEAASGSLLLDTPYTQGIAGWVGHQPASFARLELATENPFAVLLATSISDQPIATSKRLLVSAIARVEPTGFCWVDGWKRDVANPGRPPFLQEPVTANVVWRHKGKARAFVLDNTGARTDEVKLETLPGGGGVSLSIDGKTAAFHWELIAE